MNKPNLLRRSLMFTVYLWRRIMDVKVNPLKYIPDATLQAYFMLVLFSIWSVSFGFIASYHLGWLGYSSITSLVVHLSVIIPMMITNAVFVDAERTGAQWLQEWKQEKSRYGLFMNRMKAQNLVRWNMDEKAQ